MRTGFNFTLDKINYYAKVAESCSYRTQIFKIINIDTDQIVKQIAVSAPTRQKVIKAFQDSIS